jgi:hypothetical protein
VAVHVIARGRQRLLQDQQRPPVFWCNTDSRQADGLVAWWPDPSNVSQAPLTAGTLTPRLLNPQGGMGRIGSLRGEVWNGTGSTSVYRRASQVAYSTLPFTITGWAFVRNLTAGHVLVSMADEASDVIYYAINANGSTAGDPLEAHHRNGAPAAAIAATSVAYPANEPFQFAAVYTSTTSRTIYLNGGAAIGSNTDSRSAVTGIDNMAVGVLARLTPAAALDGWVDDVRVYNKALTAAEVWALYDPLTRWELYGQPSQRSYFFLSDANSALLLRLQTEGLFVGSAH